MTLVRLVHLGEICKQDRRGIRSDDPVAAGIPFIGVEQVESGSGEISLSSGSRTGEGKSTSFLFDDRHVLYGKLRPYLNKVAVPPFAGRCSTELVPLIPSSGVTREYLALLLRRRKTIDAVMAANTGARMPRADMKVLLSLEVPLPSLGEQLRIVDILNRANGILRLRRQAQEKAQQLIPALFVKMFGDPATAHRSNCQPTVPLCELAEIGSGVTKGRKLDGHLTENFPYLRVANVQDGHLVLHEVKTIAIRPNELPKYRLAPGDLLMTEGGDPDKLGRAALWSGEIDPCVHQNHVFRVRCRPGKVVPEYLRALVGSQYGKAYFLRVAKQTTGIASINKTQLGNFPALVPPLDLQRVFAARVSDIHSIIGQQSRMAAASERLVESLMHRLFERA